MSPRLHDPEEIRKLPTPTARARAVRAYFEAEKEMRRVREEVIRALRADGVTIAETAREIGVSDATVKALSRTMASS